MPSERGIPLTDRIFHAAWMSIALGVAIEIALIVAAIAFGASGDLRPLHRRSRGQDLVVGARVRRDLHNFSDFQLAEAQTCALTYTAGANGTISGTSPQTVN